MNTDAAIIDIRMDVALTIKMKLPSGFL